MDEQTKRLFEEQKRTLELFVERNAISQDEYERGKIYLSKRENRFICHNNSRDGVRPESQAEFRLSSHH